jgi:hypothetical protein
LRLLLGQASGWATLGLAVAAVALAYLFRDRLIAWHYTAGYAVAGLTVLHAWLSISPQAHSTAFTVGVWIATGAMLLIFAQVAVGLRLRQLGGDERVRQRRLHLQLMAVLALAVVAHLVLNA